MLNRLIQNPVWETLRRLRNGFVMLAAVLTVGTIGYMFVEDLPPLEAFYTTLLAVSTLGFGQFVPDSVGGYILTSGLIFTGVGTLYYLLGTFAETVIEASLGTQQQRRIERKIAHMNDHYIVCGYGMVGYHIARELKNDGQPFVIIDTDEQVVERARKQGYAALLGDATDEAILEQAGIDRACGLLAATSSDAINVMITLTARSLKDELLIVARGSSEVAEPKLRKAGASRVLAPEVIGGQRMAELAIRPTTVDVLADLIYAHDQRGWIDETHIGEDSPLVGQTLATTQLHQRTGATIIAMRHSDGHIVTNPASDEPLRAGTTLVSVGDAQQLQALAQFAAPVAQPPAFEEHMHEAVGRAH